MQPTMSTGMGQSLQSGSTDVLVSILPTTPLREVEKLVILETLKREQYNRTRTAKVLGIGIRTLQRKLKLYRAADIEDQSSPSVTLN
jgi:transcriptional regulator with PAS, ATPase and Fis domain